MDPKRKEEMKKKRGGPLQSNVQNEIIVDCANCYQKIYTYMGVCIYIYIYIYIYIHTYLLTAAEEGCPRQLKRTAKNNLKCQ